MSQICGHNQKLCATCQFYGGQRTFTFGRNDVMVESGTTGPCQHRFKNGQSTNPLASCPHHEKSGSLN